MLGEGAWRGAAAAVLASLALAGAAEAGVYRFVDEAGIVHYTNAPPDPRYRRVPGLAAAPAGVPSASRPRETRRGPLPYAELIRETAERHRVDPRLVEAVVTVESAGNPRAVSARGAQGLMQLMPQRAAALGVRDPFDPRQNVDAGVRHLRDLLQRFRGDLTLALAAYNAGEEAVRSYGGIPPYAETQEYVRRIRALYEGVEVPGPAPAPAVSRAPQRIYREVAADGTVTFTNVPPRPTVPVKPAF